MSLNHLNVPEDTIRYGRNDLVKSYGIFIFIFYYLFFFLSLFYFILFYFFFFGGGE